jgi:Family of unknown function (DUF6152)
MCNFSRAAMLASLLGCMVLLARPAIAHHGSTEFDRAKPIVVTGVVREFRWTSPHAWILLDVPAVLASGTGAAAAAADHWAFEGASVAVMVRSGWKSNSLRPGDHVSVMVAPRRDGSRSGEFMSVTLNESGKVLRLVSM